MKKDKLQINTEFFENIVACQALTNSYYTSLVLDYLNPENFKIPGNKLVIGIVKDFFSKRRTLPTITEIKTYLKKDEEVKLFKDTITSYKQIDVNGNIDELIVNKLKQDDKLGFAYVYDRFLSQDLVYDKYLTPKENK